MWENKPHLSHHTLLHIVAYDAYLLCTLTSTTHLNSSVVESGLDGSLKLLL